jgi:hypothetical protein
MATVYSPVLNDVLEMRIWTTQVEQTAVNTVRYIVTGVGGGGLTNQQIATYMDGAIAPFYKPILCNNATYRGVGISRVVPTPRTVVSYSAASTGIGTGGATNLARQTTMLISTVTAFAGPHYRGRFYTAFPPAQFQLPTADAPTVAALVALSSLAITVFQFPNSLIVGGASIQLWPLVFQARKKGPPIVPPSWNLVTNVFVRQFWATQKRRGDYGRPNQSPI